MNKHTKLLFAHKLLYEVYFYGAITIPFFVSKGYGISGALTFASAYMLTSMLMEIPTGSIGDKYGHKISIILGAIMIGVGVLGLTIFNNIIWDSLMIIIFATGGSLGSGSDTALLKNISNNFKRDNRLYSYLKSIMLLASFALAGYFVTSFGMNATVGATGVLAFLCVIPLLFIKKKKDQVEYKSQGLLQQLKEFPITLNKIKAGPSMVALGGLAGAITFSSKEIVSSLNNLYAINIETIGLLAAATMVGRLIGTALEKRLQLNYKTLFTFLIISVALTYLIDAHLILGISLVLLSTIIGQATFYRLKYNLSLIAPDQHLATTLSSLSLLGRLFSAGIIFVTAFFAGHNLFHFSFLSLAFIFTIIAIILLPNINLKDA